MRTKILIGIVVVAGILFWIGFVPATLKLGSSGQPINSGYASSTSRTLTGGVGTNLVFAGNSGVQLRCITNMGTSTVTLGFGTSTGLSATTGYVLGAPTSTVVFTGDALFTGPIYAYTVGTGTILSICEL